jgi:ATP-binding cassette, subfamily B, bacterial PglK
LLDNLKKISDLLTGRQRRAAGCLLATMVAIGLMQAASVVSVLPFLAVIANPGMVEANPWLSWAYELFGFASQRHFLIALGGVVLLSLVIVNLASAAGIWLRSRFAWGLNLHLSKALLAKYLAQPYSFHLGRNSSDFSSAILGEVSKLASEFVMPALEFLTRSITILCLFLLVVAVDPMVAAVATALFGGIYAVIYFGVRGRLGLLGRCRLAANQERFKAVQEAFGAIKETKVLQRENHFIRRYEEPTRTMTRSMISHQLVSEIPRFLLEILAFGGMLCLVLYFLATRDALGQILPVLGVYGLAGYRMMPALQTAFASFAALRFNQSVVDLIHRELSQPAAGWAEDFGPEDLNAQPLPLPFKRSIELRDVTFAYAESRQPAVRALTLTIPFRSSIALCGATGSGKTTTADIILALLKPQRGQLLVDGVAITAENRGAWQRNLGYVPQSIYLADTTIAENIAYGLPREKIDMQAVRRAARDASIAGFIERELPDGYETMVGERGVRLSGGQRQRIGIARALYHSPSVIVMDEATSALDGETEAVVMEAVRSLSKATTLIVIAHRLSTVRLCQLVYHLDRGALIDSGSYHELIGTDQKLRKRGISATTHLTDAGLGR